MSDGETTRYPFDPDGYQIGDVVPADVIERAYGRKRTDHKYRLGVLNAIDVLDKSFRSRGITATICQRKFDIEICSHVQATRYNPKRVKSAERVIRKAHERMCSIEMTALPDEETRMTLTVEVTRTGRKIQAISSLNRASPSKLLAQASAPSVKQLASGPRRPKKR